MNARTAKLLRRYAVDTGQKPRTVRRTWYLNPWNKRHIVRKLLQADECGYV